MICSDPNDFSKGSCARINAARLIDSGEVCRNYVRLAEASCFSKASP